MLGLPGRASIAQAVGTGFTVVGLLIALPRFGITGAAVVTTIDFAVTLAVQLLFLHRAGARRFVPTTADMRGLAARVRSSLPSSPRRPIALLEGELRP